jgi:methylthioribose-1-phosphate isomerase
MRAIEWDQNQKTMQLLDQRVLPGEVAVVICTDQYDTAEAIRNMTVRGAPIIGVAAAFGMVLAAYRAKAADVPGLQAELHEAARVLNAARPTAVNLPWALARMLRIVDAPASTVTQVGVRLEAEALAMAEEDVAVNKRISEYGAALIEDGDTIIHHCNTGALATVDWGTALGCIRMAHEQGKRIQVLVDETRPRLQGARLTAWELQQYGVPFHLIADGAAGYFLRSGQVQKVLFGADRVAANGDVANKIGSYMLALAASTNRVPVYSVFPVSTVDFSLANGDLIPIEEREADEVLGIQIKGRPATPAGALARNPAFDVTPQHLLSGWITEYGVIRSPFEINLKQAMETA